MCFVFHRADYELFQIELAKNYGVAEWRDDIKRCMLKAGLQNQPITFLFSDTQIKSESFLEVSIFLYFFMQFWWKTKILNFYLEN